MSRSYWAQESFSMEEEEEEENWNCESDHLRKHGQGMNLFTHPHTLNRYHQNGWNQKKSSFGIEDNQFLPRKVNSEFEAGNYHKANIPGHAVRVKDMPFEHRYEARNGHRTNNSARTMWMEDTSFKHDRFEARNGHKERFPAQAIIEDMSFEEHRRWDADAVFHRQEFDNGFNCNGFKKIECIPKAI